jgi:hypothetical protein
MALTTVTGSLVSVNAIQGTLIADNAITAVHIATNAVSGTLIADNAVTAVHIAQNTITVTQLADDCVESDKIADGIITTNHLNKAMISSQTEVTAATGDFVLLGDTSDSNNLKKVPVSSIVALASSLTSDFTLTSTDAGSSASPIINLVRDSSSPADADYIGQIKFKGEDDGGASTTYSKITGKIGDASNGSEDGIIEFAAQKAGSSTILARLSSTKLALLNSTELEAPVVDAENFKVNGGQGSDGQVLTSTGSGVAWEDASGGVAGIVSSADATAITIDSSERVGIGIASPTTELHIFSADQNALTVETDTAVNQIHLSNSTNSPTYITQDSYGLTFKADDNGWGGTASNITFKVKGSEKARILSSGGITFNGDTAAANALDDYEEGTWTPAFYTYSGVTTSSISTYGIYTKIGNICHIHAKITCTLSSLPGQTVIITGLPFAATNTSDTGQRSIIAVGGDSYNTGANTPKAHFRTDGSQLQGVYYNASSNTAYWTYSSMDAQPFEMHIHGHYTTT